MSVPNKRLVRSASSGPVELERSYAWCRSLCRRTAGNFYFSFLTLPPDRLRDMYVLYAFMRVSDDLGDDDRLPNAERATKLKRWRMMLQRALDGDGFQHELFPALSEVVSRYHLPHEYLHAVLDGVEMDLNSSGFETFDDLSQYCYRVAGVVGLCCIHIWGFHDERANDRAIDCGLAFQLTNILRDLSEDAALGRIYLPREDLRRFGYSGDDIVAQQLDERFVQLMRFEVDRARSYYRRAWELFDNLEPPGRPIYRAMLQTYGGLLDRIEQSGYDVYSRRIKLPKWRKVFISIDAIVRERWFGRMKDEG